MVLFYGGNIEPYRRVDMLIYAFSNLSKKYPKLRLIISGYGKSKKDLIRKTNKLGLSKSVIFIDWLPRKEMPKLLSMVDVCIDTYPRSDWPTCMTPSDKLLEWMSSGKCVITSRVYSHSQIIKDGFNGLLYEPGSIEDLVSKLEMLFRNNEMIKALGNNARRIIKEKYDVRKVVPLFEDFCVNVLFEQYARTTQ
jgi:glycosyltransferase involved in cell wall biosynthesis